MSVQVKDFKEYVSKMAERKKTSPSGIHLGIYKALSQDPELLQIPFQIMSFALSSRIILPRWRQTHQLLLQKDPQPYINRLRYITILEVDVQFIMKRCWAKKLQSEVDNGNLMSQQQYARKGVTTMDNLWSRQLTFD